MTDTAPLGLRPLTVSQERDTPKVSRSFSLFLSLRPRAWSRGKQSKNRLLRLRQLTDPRLPTAGRQRHIILNKNKGRTRSFNQGELVKRTVFCPVSSSAEMRGRSTSGCSNSSKLLREPCQVTPASRVDGVYPSKQGAKAPGFGCPPARQPRSMSFRLFPPKALESRKGPAFDRRDQKGPALLGIAACPKYTPSSMV